MNAYFFGHALIVRLRLGNVNFYIYSHFSIPKYIRGQLGITANGGSSVGGSGGFSGGLFYLMKSDIFSLRGSNGVKCITHGLNLLVHEL